MKVCVLADTHAGVRNNSSFFMEEQIKFFEEQFFPFCEKYKIEHMIHLGDIFDQRKQTNNFVIDEWNRRVFSRWNDTFKESHFLIGNHDTSFKNTNKINTPQSFLSHHKNFKFYVDPQELDLYGVKTLILPWICEDNAIESQRLIENSFADLVLAHLEVIGCPMFKGIENKDHGFQQFMFKRFKKVLSGHYHIKSNHGNLDYLGAAISTTVAEMTDIKGFHLLDMDTLKLAFIENPNNPYLNIEYSDTPLSEVPNAANKIVRITVNQKSSESGFLEFLEKIEEQNPAEVNVQEQITIATLDGEVSADLDLFSLMDLYVDSLNFESPKPDLKNLLRELYQEALSSHNISE